MKKTGTIEALNVSPKGFYEGFLLRTGKRIAQINLGKEHRHHSLKLGEKVTVEVEREEPEGKPAHEVFRLVGRIDGDGPSGDFSGVVVTLNYALHGEVNGGILDSGDFLHLKPAGARAVKLKVGMLVKGKGGTRSMVDGHTVLEADEVNGIAIERGKAKKHHRGE